MMVARRDKKVIQRCLCAFFVRRASRGGETERERVLSQGLQEQTLPAAKVVVDKPAGWHPSNTPAGLSVFSFGEKKVAQAGLPAAGSFGNGGFRGWTGRCKSTNSSWFGCCQPGIEWLQPLRSSEAAARTLQ
jgi:hypothetical protein